MSVCYQRVTTLSFSSYFSDTRYEECMGVSGSLREKSMHVYVRWWDSDKWIQSILMAAVNNAFVFSLTASGFVLLILMLWVT